MYQQQLEQEYNVPFGEFLPKVCFVMLGDFIGIKQSVLEQKAQELINEYPKIHVGYTLLAALKTFSQPEERDKLVLQAHKVAEQNPDQNSKLLYLLPDKKVHFEDYKLIKPHKHTIQEGKLWTYDACVVLPKDTWCVNQSSIVKREDGTLTIINPSYFDEEAVNWINSLGDVTSLVTTTAGHGFSITKATSIWPHAKVYGTSPSTKHDHPELKWNFLSDEKQEFGDDLVHLQLKGNIFSETVFFHPSSKSLLGFTDLLIDCTETSDWALKMYLFSVGVFRRQGVQGYLYPGVTDWHSFSKSLSTALKWEPEHLILGHGGQYHGKQQIQQRISDSYSWLLNPSTFPSWFERRVYLPLKWIRGTKIAPALLNQRLYADKN